MKTFRKFIAMFLAVLMLLSIAPVSALADFVREQEGEEYILQNDYIRVTVNSKNGRFSIRTVEGQPVRKTDQNSLLTFLGGLFGLGETDTSFTTFRINGTDYIFGNNYKFTAPNGLQVQSTMGGTKVFTSSEYPSIPEGCQAVTTQWSVEGVSIIQLLLLYPETDEENSGNVQIFYNIENNSGADVQVGARILLDTMVGVNDGPEFQIGTISSNTLRVERMLSRDPVYDQGIALENQNYWTLPNYWVVRDTLDPTNPLATNVIAYGYTDIAGYRDLDYMIVSHWYKLANGKFEEFDDYKAIPAEQAEAAAEVARTQRLANQALAVAEQKEAEAVELEAAADGAEEGSKAKEDAKKARETATKVRKAANDAVKNAEAAQKTLEAVGRTQVGSSIIEPNLDFTSDKNDYGSADSAVAFYWSGEGEAARIAPGSSMQLGTVYGLGEIIDPTSVLAITFPDPVTQVEMDPNDPDSYKNYGVFDINVEVENLALYDMEHESIDITMTLEKNLRFVKRDEEGNILRDENGVPITSYGSTQTAHVQKALTPEQAAAGETNPIVPGEKIATTFTVMAIGKPWPTTRQYMVTATSPELEMEFENKYGNSAGADVKAMYNSSRANFIFLPSVGDGTPSYSVSVSPEECFTKDPKYITVNLTNIEAYNPGSSVRGQEASPNFNLYFKEVVTGKRYQIDVTDNVQCIVTDDGLTGDMRISYLNGTLVDENGVALELDLGCVLPVGEYCVEIDYISTDEDENAMLDLVTAQTFLVTENEEARIREPAILAVVKETVNFDDNEVIQKINELVEEVQAAIEELQGIAEKLNGTDWTDAIYDEVIEFAKELISPVTQIYDSLEKLTDFTNIESEMAAIAKEHEELADLDFSSIRNFDVMKAIKGVNVDVSLSDEFKNMFSVDELLLGPLGLSGLSDLVGEGGSVEDVFGSIGSYGTNMLKPITDIYEQIASLGDFSKLTDSEIAQLKAAFGDLKDVDFNALKDFHLDVSIGLNEGKLAERFKELVDIGFNPFGGDSSSNGVDAIYDAIKDYGESIVMPIKNLYDDILELCDFSTLTNSEIAQLKAAYKDLEDIDFSSLTDFDLEKFLNGASVSVTLKKKFESMVDLETLIKGPFGSIGSGDGSTMDGVYKWLQDYAKKLAAPVLSIFDDLSDIADFSNITKEMEELSKTYKDLEGIDFSALEDLDLSALIDGIDINVDFTEKFKELFDYEAILAGPFGDSSDPNKSAMEVFKDRITDYGKKAFSPLISIYDDLTSLTDFTDIQSEMEALSKNYAELEGVDFSALADFDFNALIDGLDVNVSLSDKFKELFDYEAILAGPFSGVKDENGNEKSAMEVFEDRITDYGKKALSPILSIYDDLEGLTDFTDIEKEMEELSKNYEELEGVDFSALADFSLSDLIDGLDVNVSFSDKFKELFDYEAILKGPFGDPSDPNKSATDVLEERILAYAKKTFSPIFSLYDDIEGLANFDSIIADMDRLSQDIDGLGDLDFSCLEDFDVEQAIKDLWNATTVDVDLSDSFKKTVNAALDGPAEFDADAITAWLNSVGEVIAAGKEVYDLGKSIYDGGLNLDSLMNGAKGVMALYQKYVNANISVNWDSAISKANKDAATATFTQGEKLALAFVAMYAKMKDIYSGLKAKYDKAMEIFNQVKEIKNTVVSVITDLGNGDFSKVLALGEDALRFVLGEWLDPIENAYNSAMALYNIGLRAYKGDLSLREGAQMLVDFCETYLDISISVDPGQANIDAAKSVYSNSEKLVLAFMAMYARMENIYSGLSDKVERAKGIYDDVMEIKDTVVRVFKSITSGDFSALLSVGKDAVQFVLGEWLSPVKDAYNSAKKLYEIAMHAYKGDLSLREGAQMLVDFCETYLDINVSVNPGQANIDAAKSVYSNGEKMVLAFMAMYARLQNIYSGLNAKYNKAKGIFDDVMDIKDKVVNVVTSLMNGDFTALLNAGKDALVFVLGEWLSPVEDAYNSAKKLYEIALHAYKGDLSLREGAQMLVDFCETYLDISISVNPGQANVNAVKDLANNGEKLVVAFMAMYAKLRNIYSSVNDKVNRGVEVYNQAKDLVNTVVKIGGQLLSGDFSSLTSIINLNTGKELLEMVLNAWMTPVMDTINSAKDLYSIGQKAFSGDISAKEGARLVMSFFETYLDVDVKADLSGLKNAAAGAYTDAQKAAAAFMVIFARMENIYNSMSTKVQRANEVYNQARSIINTVIKLIKVVASGDFNKLASMLLDMGTDVISSVLDMWMGKIEDGIDSVKDLYNIGQRAFKGDISLEEGARMLIDFYESYLNVSVTANLKGATDGNLANDAEKTAAAFMVMYARMRSLYSSVDQALDTVTGLYNSAKGIIRTVIKLVSDPLGALNDIVDMGEDAIFTLLNSYIDKINNIVDSVKEIYEIGKKAYEGKLDIREGAELLIGFFQKYLKLDISYDLDAIGEDNIKAAKDTYNQGKKMALAFMAIYARMQNIYTSLSSKVGELTGIYDQVMEIVDTVKKLFTDPASGAYALLDLIKDKIMDKLDGLGMYKDMFMDVLDVLVDFDKVDPSQLMDQAMDFAVTAARVKADQALYSTIYGMLVTAATALDPNSDYEWNPGDLKPSLPTYRLMSFGDEAEYQAYVDKITAENEKKKATARKDATDGEKKAALVGNDGVMVKITGLIRQLGDGENVTDYIVDTSSEPAIINNTVAFKGGDLVFSSGKLKISFGDIATIDAGDYISKAQSIYGSETPLFDTLFVSGTGQLYIESSGFVFHDGEWSIDFYNGFDKILDPVKVEDKEKENKNQESDALNETAAWAIGTLNDLFNPLKALAITDVYFNRHTLFSAPSFSVAGFGLEFDNYLLRTNQVCFGGHIDFKIVKGEIQNVFYTSSGLKSIEADLKFDLGGDLGLLEKGETAGGNLIIHYYDPDYLASFRERGYEPPVEKYGLDFNAKLKSVGGVGVQLSFKRVADGRILPDIIGFQVTPPAPGFLVTGGTYLTAIRGAIKELADTIAGGSSTVPLTIEAGVDITFGQAPAVFDGKIDMILKMTGIEFNGKLGYKGKPMITQAQIKAQWVTPWFVSASMEMDVLGLNIIIGKARIFIGQNLEKDRIDFEGFVSAALQIPKSVPVVGGFQLGQVSFGLNNDKIWGSASVGITPIAVSVGITYYWGGGVEFGTNGEDLPEAYTYLLLERPEEEPVLLAIGSGMRTEATSWVNENTIHEIEYHAIGDGMTLMDNGQNDIGIGGIEVTNEGMTHVIPLNNVANDRDALIEVEYYDEDIPDLTLVDSENAAYDIVLGDMANPRTGDSAFKQELVTEDGVNRHLVYIMVPRSRIRGSGSYTLTANQRVQTKLLSTPISSSLGDVTLSSSGNTYTANVTVANAHEGDTVSLYLTKEPVGTAAKTITTKNASGETVELPVTEDRDPGVTIFENIPVENGAVVQDFDLSNISGPYAVDGLGDIQQLLESGEYYLRAALKSETGYDAKTSANHITLTDPKAPNSAGNVVLTPAGNGYFDLSFRKASALEQNAVKSYRVDFYTGDGALYSNYNGLLFDAADIEKYLNEAGDTYTLRIGGWTVTGGEGTAEDPYTYSGLETGNTYVAKVYAANQTEDGNYHYASPAENPSAILLPVPQYAQFTGIAAESGTLRQKSYTDADGATVQTTAKELITNETAPTLTLTTSIPATVEAYNGDTQVGVMDASGKLQLTGLTTDGSYALELRATNTLTQDKSVTILYVTIDSIRPTILLLRPGAATEASVSFSSIAIEGMTEPGSTVTVNGSYMKVDKDGNFTGSVTLPNTATGKLNIVAKDEAGNTNNAVVSLSNKDFAAPLGVNVVRTGTMKTGETQVAEVYLSYANGTVGEGKDKVLKFRSEEVPQEDRDKLSFSVAQGDAVTVSEDGTITALREGAALIAVSYQVNEGMTLKTLLAVLVEKGPEPEPEPEPEKPDTGGGGGGGGSGGGSSGGGSSGGSSSSSSTADTVINGISGTVSIEEGTATVTITSDDGVTGKERLDVDILSDKADRYVLEVEAEVAEMLSGEDGAGIRFVGGGTQIDLPGKNLTGEAITITIAEPGSAAQLRSSKAAKALGAKVVTPGCEITVTGVEIEPGDRVLTQIEIPAGVKTNKITALVYVDENGNYTSIPWKLTVTGSTAYLKCYLPGSGTLVPMTGTISFRDVGSDYWGYSAIREAAGMLLIRGYEDGSFRPGNSVSRAEFATIMLRACGLLTAPVEESNYADVSESDWYYDEVSIATALHILTGYEDGTFQPNKDITRTEGMVIACRLLKLEKLCGDMNDEDVEQVLSAFKDQDKVPAWARKEIAMCIRSGLIVGSDGCILPGDPLSRVEAAIIATRLCDSIEKTM